MTERTLVILKPDGVEKNLELIISGEIANLGLRQVDRRLMHLSREIVTRHYAHHASKPFFPTLCDYMTRGPVVALVFEGDDAVAKVRDLVGVTNPAKAAKHTIRARFGKCVAGGAVENVVHASEKPEEAEAEIKRFFGGTGWWGRLLRWFRPKAFA